VVAVLVTVEVSVLVVPGKVDTDVLVTVSVVVGPETVAVDVAVDVAVSVDITVLVLPCSISVDVEVEVVVLEPFARYPMPAPTTSPPTTPAPIFRKFLRSGLLPPEVVLPLESAIFGSSKMPVYMRITQLSVVYRTLLTQLSKDETGAGNDPTPLTPNRRGNIDLPGGRRMTFSC